MKGLDYAKLLVYLEFRSFQFTVYSPSNINFHGPLIKNSPRLIISKLALPEAQIFSNFCFWLLTSELPFASRQSKTLSQGYDHHYSYILFKLTRVQLSRSACLQFVWTALTVSLNNAYISLFMLKSQSFNKFYLIHVCLVFAHSGCFSSDLLLVVLELLPIPSNIL